MVSICKHTPHKSLTHIFAPKYSTDEVLINTALVTPGIEHYIIKFKQCNKYPDWFYLSGSVIRKCRVQSNGRGTVYVVPMSAREEFNPIKECEHEL